MSLLASVACGAPPKASRPDVPAKALPSGREAAAVPSTMSAAPAGRATTASRPTRFIEPTSSFAWSFPDASARKANAERLAKKIEKQLDDEHSRAATGAGFSFALVIDGEIALTMARGIADLDNKRVATPDTIYRVASITKTFTATSVMALRDDKKLALADALADHLRDLDVGYPHRDDAPVRIEQLLTHSAGLVRSGPYAELSRASTEDDLAQAMKLPLTGDPGVSYRYSNFAFGLLGLVVGRVSGMPYRVFVESRLLRPLGMTSSGFDVATLPADRLAVGYKRANGTTYAPVTPSANGAGEGAGGLYTTARDMAQWLRMNLAAWPPRDDPEAGPVRRSTLREMHTPRFSIGTRGATPRLTAESVGVAWKIERGCYFDRLVEHDGDLDSFHARVRFDPQRGLGFVLLTNSDGADASGIVERLLDTVATEDALAAFKREPAPDLVAAATAVVKKLGPEWSEDDHARAFTQVFAGQFTRADAVALGERITRDVGGSCALARVESVTDALDAELKFRCAKGTLRASVRGTGTPFRLFGFKLDASRPAEPEQLDTARAVAERMARRDDEALARTLRSKAGLASHSRLLSDAGAKTGACRVESGEASPWSRAAVFRLACAKSRAELRLTQRESGAIEINGIDLETRCLR